MRNYDVLVERIRALMPVPVLNPILAAAGAARAPQARPPLWMSSDDRDSVDVERRRRQSGPGGGRGRADAPGGRQRDDQPSPPPSTGGFTGGDLGGPSGGGQLPLGDLLSVLLRLPPPILGLLLLGVCCIAVAFFVFGGGSGLGTNLIAPPVETSAPFAGFATDTPRPLGLAPTLTPAAAGTGPTRPATAPTAAGSGPRWLVMLYQDAKDKVLDQDIFTDMNDAERTGSTDRVQIVSQIDRARTPQNRAEWGSAKRFLLTRDADLRAVHSRQVADLGQVNMADPRTLIDFVTWAVKTYPADKYVLILSDHGMGWPGGWSDPAVTTSASSNRGVPLASAIGNLLFLNDMDQALSTIRSQTGVDKFELIGLDACLMSQAEVLTALAPHARYAVASEETEPALGWAYTAFLDTLVANPNITGAELGRAIVKTYITSDQRIVDDQARAELTSRGSVLGGLFGSSALPSAAQVAQQMESEVTLTAVDLQAFPALLQSLNNLAFALQQADPKAVSQARQYAQSYTSVFGQEVPPSYIDLGHWVELLGRTNPGSAVTTASQQVLSALQSTVIAEKHGSGKPGSTGISIYFPNSQLYRNPVAGPQSYTAIANRFASQSLWDDYLGFFYTGRRFTQAAGNIVVPDRSATITAPAAGGIQVSNLKLSTKTTAPGKPISLSVDVDGKNVGYVKLFVGFYDRTANSINVTDEDYLESSQTQQLRGVYYPVWPESGRFTVRYEWDPTVFAIDDGSRAVTALFWPETYGASAADAVYTVDGTYTHADGSGSQPARLYFRDGRLRQAFVFTGSGTAGSPWEIKPQRGDTFTVLEKWIDLDASGNPVKTGTQNGRAVTFGDQPLTWKDLDPAAGEYVIGFIVEDLDGNETPIFDRITIQ